MDRRRRTVKAELQLVRQAGDALSSSPRLVNGKARRLVEDDRFPVDEEDAVAEALLDRFGQGNWSLSLSTRVGAVDQSVTPSQRIKGFQPVTLY